MTSAINTFVLTPYKCNHSIAVGYRDHPQQRNSLERTLLNPLTLFAPEQYCKERRSLKGQN